MEVEQILHMKGGLGETSYANNSLLQGKVISMTKAIIEDATSEVFCSNNMASNSKVFSMAELGCSSGPTTLLPAAEVVKTVHRLSRKQGRELPEFQILLNDLPGNDFNSISQRFIPIFQAQLREEIGEIACFVYGVPGSFYGRIFPANTLHLLHSSYSLMWLSKVPEGILEMNKGCIFIGSESPLSVINAYHDQFHRDFATFLRCRSEEVVVGGKMVLTILVRESERAKASNSKPKSHCYTWELLGFALKQMVCEGLVEEDKLDSFNIPQYMPSPREIKEEVKEEGSFKITQLEEFEISWGASSNVANSIRSIAEPLILQHFGKSIIDHLFIKYQKIVSDYMSSSTQETKFFNLTLSMTRT